MILMDHHPVTVLLHLDMDDHLLVEHQRTFLMIYDVECSYAATSQKVSLTDICQSANLQSMYKKNNSICAVMSTSAVISSSILTQTIQAKEGFGQNEEQKEGFLVCTLLPSGSSILFS